MTPGESNANTTTRAGYSLAMFPGIGTVINVVAIIGGAGLGILLGQRLNSKTRTLLTDVLGLATLLGAASALIPMWSNRYVESLAQGVAAFGCSWISLNWWFDRFGFEIGGSTRSLR